MDDLREKPLYIRPATYEDIPSMLKVENEAWPEEEAFTEDHFLSHLKVLENFREGLQVAVIGNQIIGIGLVEMLTYDLNNPIPTWYEATDDGFLVNSHDFNGNILYGVSLSVSPKYSAFTVGRKLLDVSKSLVVKYNKKRLVLGSRIPRYQLYSDSMSAEEYVNRKRGNRLMDPELEFYRKCGLRIIRVLPDYFVDPQSLNYGVLVVWENNQ